ncbi:VOC family protein, partial [Rhizobium leguminosarum]|uniref:VOC family protein n=1 Tax=Rhizobium leguminosarum TaxID=384 RepID=UPI003F987C05
KASAFYVERLGFKPRRRAPGFADFKGAGVTLALWEIEHIAENTGVSSRRAPQGAHKACAAIELASPEQADALSMSSTKKQMSVIGLVWAKA